MIRHLLRAFGVYALYEALLLRGVSKREPPRHIAVILDGNRRWAKQNGLSIEEGYRMGAKRVEELLRWCLELGVNTVTLYVLSLENMIRRPKEEVETIYKVLVESTERFLLDEEVRSKGVRVKVIGRNWVLPEEVASALERLERETSHNSNHFLILAVAYGGRDEIIQAVRRVAHDVSRGELSLEDVNEDVFSRYLFTGELPFPEPDLVIRTSGEERISNFLLWQIAYSELIFLDVYWPEFRRIDLLRAIRTYQARSRRFGA
ncbi:MAG: polyprenyl diphosphate synthase [Thaumarchaeota archaeon]|nr:polyprenyl diphosphate synthase [Candidatus Calditenuaceae archaeon]MDW8041273.1 polyprenyl diphosphate synthase [Nitrososphaerota archaeon]